MTDYDTTQSRIIVDFASSGHHSKYLRQVVRYGLRADKGGLTRLLISRELLVRTELELTAEEQILLRSRACVIEEQPAYMWLLKWIGIRAIVDRLFVEYLIATQPLGCEIILLYLDPFLFQLACLPLPRKRISGLLFRTSFHYRHTGFKLEGIREFVVFLAKYVMCYLCVRRRGVHRILVLDPFAQSYSEQKWRTTKYITIPDPIGPEPETQAICPAPRTRDQRGLSVFLVCGELSRRKGVLVVLRALAALEPAYLRQVRLRLVGRIHDAERELVLGELVKIRQRHVLIEIELDDRFVSDEELDRHIADADVLLTLYERSFGSSGSVIRAATLGRPVIATDRGLVGHLVRVQRLGVAVDVRDLKAVTEAFRSFIRTGIITGFDPESAREYAACCAPPVFAHRLLAFDTTPTGTAMHDEKLLI